MSQGQEPIRLKNACTMLEVLRHVSVSVNVLEILGTQLIEAQTSAARHSWFLTDITICVTRPIFVASYTGNAMASHGRHQRMAAAHDPVYRRKRFIFECT